MSNSTPESPDAAEAPEPTPTPVPEPVEGPLDDLVSGASTSSATETVPVPEPVEGPLGDVVSGVSTGAATETVAVPEPVEGSLGDVVSGASTSSATETASVEDAPTGEVEVPAEPRAASEHVNASGVATAAVATEPVAGPSTSSGTGTATGTGGGVAAAPTPIYVSTPTPPKNKGNRGAGILIAVLATITYAVVHALVVLGLFALNRHSEVIDDLGRYVITPAYWATAIVFFLTLILLVAIANRGGWWWYAVGGFFVGVIVYFGYIGATLLTNAWVLTPSEVGRFVGELWSHPLTIAAAVVAREVTVWFGAWISARGRKVRARNTEARQAYDREVAEGPQLRQPVAGQA